MGQEIVYCSGCQVRIVGSDFEKGDAYRVGDQAACPKCAMQMLTTAPPAVQQQIIEQKKRALDRKMGSHAPSSIWRGLMRPSPALLESKNARTPRSQIATLAGLGVALVILVGMILMSDGSPPPQQPVKPPVVIAGPSPKDAAAEGALQAAKPFAPDNPSKLDEQAAAELTSLLARTREMGVNTEYQKAADLLAVARKNHPEAEWTKPIDDRIQELETSMAAEFPALRDKAVDTRRRDGAAELGLIREKVARWGSARYSEELEKALTEVFPPVTPKSDGTLKLDIGEAVIQGNNKLTRTKGDWRVTQGWTNMKDWVEWSVVPRQAGVYTIRMNYAVPKEMKGTVMGGDFEIGVAGGESKQFTLEPTAGWGDFKTITYGTITLPATGCTIAVKPVKILHNLMSLRFVELVPAK